MIGDAKRIVPSGGSGNNLSNLLEFHSPTAYRLMARPGNNLGNTTLVFSVPMADFFRMSIIANDPTLGPIAQRKLDTVHASKLAQYMCKGLVGAARNLAERQGRDLTSFDHVLTVLGPQPYIAVQPVVVNIRTAGANGQNLAGEKFPATGPTIAYEVALTQRDLFYVIDGQHRRMGIEMLLAFLDDVRRSRAYPKKGSLFPYDGHRDVTISEMSVWEDVYEVARGVCTIAVEAHLGLELEQERQLFHDLNNLTKKVERSLALEFDSSNPVNQFIKTSLLEQGRVELAPGEKVDWNDPKSGAFTRKDLIAINAHLILNKSNANGASALDVQEKEEVAIRFWEAVGQCDGFGDDDARNKTVLAQPVVLKAIAKLTYDFAFGRAKQRSTTNLNLLLDRLTDLDFSHSNPMWRFYEMSESERRENGIDGLTAYLPPEGTGNRDIGAYDAATGVMRFGSKHNDIFPLLGDMIRWRLGLPSRHAEAKE